MSNLEAVQLFGKYAPYAKFIVAILGTALTSALSVATAGSGLFVFLVIASSAVTAAGVYLTPNVKPSENPDPLTEEAIATYAAQSDPSQPAN